MAKDHAVAMFEIIGIAGDLKPRQTATRVAHKDNGSSLSIPRKVRRDTPEEVDY